MATKFEVVLSAQLDKDSKSDIQKQINDISKGTKLSIKSDSRGVDSMNKSIQGLSNSASNAKTHTQGLNDIIGKFASWQIVGDIIHGVKNAMNDMVQQVVDLDSSLVEFNKVTDLSKDELDSFTSSAYESAEQLARTGKEIIDLSTEFSKAGYKDQALDLAETAALYQNIADSEVSASDASALLVSQMKAFNVSAEDSINIVDQINEVSNNFAVSSSDLKARSNV